MEGREALNEVHGLLSDVDPGQHVEDRTHELPWPRHGALIAPKLPSLLDLVLVLCAASCTGAALRGFDVDLQLSPPRASAMQPCNQTGGSIAGEEML